MPIPTIPINKVQYENSQKIITHYAPYLNWPDRMAKAPVHCRHWSEQGIPPQFLQVIMRELRQGGFVESRRGKDGGYILNRPLRIGHVEVIRFLSMMSLGGFTQRQNSGLPSRHIARSGYGERTYDSICAQELVDRDNQNKANAISDYVI